MQIDEKALQAAIAWYWRAGAISENIPRGCIREYLANLPKASATDQPDDCRATFARWWKQRDFPYATGSEEAIAREAWQEGWSDGYNRLLDETPNEREFSDADRADAIVLMCNTYTDAIETYPDKNLSGMLAVLDALLERFDIRRRGS